MDNCFFSADILLPKMQSLEKWAVIACDQFTSEPEYWKAVRKFVGDGYSALHMIIPEAELTSDMTERIAATNGQMERYLTDGLFKTYPDAFVYVERRLLSGNVRRGIVGAVDLQCYSYGAASTPIRATEETVMERIPPRVAVRTGAPMEFTHILLLCDDQEQTLIESVAKIKETLPMLYDFDLMAGGGHITGWLISGDACKVFQQRLSVYSRSKQDIVFAVGDGNHSLAAAKACYELDGIDPRSRYALAELVNIHDSAIVFEPIHRIVMGTDVSKLLSDLEQICCDDGVALPWYSGERSGVLYLDTQGKLPVAALQTFLDEWLSENEGVLDYIHEDASLISLTKEADTIGFLLPTLNKSSLFPFVAGGSVLPRKAFSMGLARDKRYYLEGRKIK